MSVGAPRSALVSHPQPPPSGSLGLIAAGSVRSSESELPASLRPFRTVPPFRTVLPPFRTVPGTPFRTVPGTARNRAGTARNRAGTARNRAGCLFGRCPGAFSDGAPFRTVPGPVPLFGGPVPLFGRCRPFSDGAAAPFRTVPGTARNRGAGHRSESRRHAAGGVASRSRVGRPRRPQLGDGLRTRARHRPRQVLADLELEPAAARWRPESCFRGPQPNEFVESDARSRRARAEPSFGSAVLPRDSSLVRALTPGQHLNSVEAFEVSRVKRQNTRKAVGSHPGDDAGVVGTLATDGACLDELEPFGKQIRRIRPQRNSSHSEQPRPARW